MARNEGTFDRVLRVLIGAVLMAAWWLGWVAGTLAVVSLIVGAVLVLTGLVGVCPLYAAFGLNTRSAK